MRIVEHDGSSEGAARYDLSKVPRPLYLGSLTCWRRPTVETWEIVVNNLSFSTVVARTPCGEDAMQLVKEISDVLKAHRVLAGTTTYNDDLDHVR